MEDDYCKFEGFPDFTEGWQETNLDLGYTKERQKWWDGKKKGSKKGGKKIN